MLRRASSRLALASALLGLTLGSLAMPAAAAQPAENCAANPGHKPTILFVHGLLGKGSDWKPFMDYVNQHIDNVQTEAFDYSGANTQWVTNPAIGPRLASHITCMYQASGKPVVVVAHSMGGLATREALRDNPNLVSQIGLAVTVATPNTGSDAARDAIVLAQSVCALTGCQAATNGALQAMSAYRGLASGSKELQDLPDWPKTLPVYAMAGNITPVYYLPYFNASKFSWELTALDGSPSNTDTLVTTSSALHGVQAKGMGGTTEFGCKANAPILPMLTQATCEHGALIMSDQNNVRSKTVEVIKGYLSQQTSQNSPEPTLGDAPSQDATCPKSSDFTFAINENERRSAEIAGLKPGYPTTHVDSAIYCDNHVGAAWVKSSIVVHGRTERGRLLVVIQRKDVRLQALGKTVSDSDRRQWELFDMTASRFYQSASVCEISPPLVLQWLYSQGSCTQSWPTAPPTS